MQILTKRSKNMLYLIIMVASLFAMIATSSAIPRASPKHELHYYHAAKMSNKLFKT